MSQASHHDCCIVEGRGAFCSLIVTSSTSEDLCGVLTVWVIGLALSRGAKRIT